MMHVAAMQQVQLAGGNQPRTSTSSGGGDAEEETCRFPKLQECAHFHYERVTLGPLFVCLQPNDGDNSIHSLQHTSRGSDDMSDDEFYTLKVTANDESWLLQRSLDNFIMLDSQLHQCIFDRKVSLLPELTHQLTEDVRIEVLSKYLTRFCAIVDNSLNCGPVLTWFQLDNRGHRLLVPNEESDSINTPAVAAAYSIKKYVSQARDELNLEVGDMISVIDMASPGESMWWRGKRGFQVGFFPQHCVHVIGEKLACLPHAPNALGAGGTVSPIKPVLRKHGKLIAFFRSFILNRPSRRRLKQSGILRERVFGCDLGEHLLNSGHEIPMVLKCCAEFIETHGIVDGIYRLSGVTSNIQKLRNAFDEDRIPNLYTDDILQDIHSVASLLKMYFRELPNPLCTYQLYHSFVNAVQGTHVSSSGVRSKLDENERLLRMRETVQKLPPPHYRTLEYLMRHLARVAKHGSSTGMTSRNVAIVWAPNLLRCAELEVGGVAALQGVGVQAVVTEFLVCYTDLIFCDNLPNVETGVGSDESQSSNSPKKLRPKSLAISTPTKLLSLEEARNKHSLSSRPDENNYIEVGGGPKNLPEKYHTVLELPQGFRKRNASKRSPLGWRSFFSKSRNNSHSNLTNKNTRKASTPGCSVTTSFQEKSVTESDLTEIRRKLRPVKSAESLTSGQSEPPNNEIDTLGPLHCLNKPSGHNRSVSHDSYFDTLQNSNHNSELSLLDLSEIQLNFELEESEMRIFSEDESLVSSPRVHREPGAMPRKILSRARPEEFSSNTNSNNPSPKKQARVVLSPESQSRKRSRLEDQLSDILYIDCNTPENTICTTALVHNFPDKIVTVQTSSKDEIEPKNKSPRNSNEINGLTIEQKDNCETTTYKYVGSKNNRNSLNLEAFNRLESQLPKSLTEFDLKRTLPVPGNPSAVSSANLSPQTPNYNRLINEIDSSETTPNEISPDFSLTESPTEISYKNLNRISGESQKFDEDEKNIEVSNTYENISNDLTEKTSPKKSEPSSPCYENVLTTISITYSVNSPLKKQRESNIYEDINVSGETSEEASQESRGRVPNIDELLSKIQKTPTNSPKISPRSSESSPIRTKFSSPVRPISLSFQVNQSLSSSGSSPSTPSTKPPVYENLDANQFPANAESEDNENNVSKSGVLINEKRKSCETEENYNDEDAIYQQVKYFRRSIHEINELLDAPFELKVESNVNANSCERVTPVCDRVPDVPDDNVQDGQNCNSNNNLSLSNVMCKTKTNDHEMNDFVTSVEVDPNKYEVQCKESDILYSETDTDRFDSLESDISKSPPQNHSENIKEIIHEIENSNVDVVKKSSFKPSRKKSESVREIASKFENFESDSSVRHNSLSRERNRDSISSGRDSLPPCLRARFAKLVKNNPKTRSLDENEFNKEFVPCNNITSTSLSTLSLPYRSSISRRKSLDGSLSRFSTISTQPKSLNQPKLLPDAAKKSPDFHSTHSLPSAKKLNASVSSPPSLSLEDIRKNYKTNPLSDTSNIRCNLPPPSPTKINSNQTKLNLSKHPQDRSEMSHSLTALIENNSNAKEASLSLTESIHVENPQLNRERIEKYKEERRNYLREKYRSESFRADKDQVLVRLKQKIKPKLDSDENREEILKDSLEYTDVIEVSNTIDRHDNFVKNNRDHFDINQRLKKIEPVEKPIRKYSGLDAPLAWKKVDPPKYVTMKSDPGVGKGWDADETYGGVTRRRDLPDTTGTTSKSKLSTSRDGGDEVRRHTFDTSRERESEGERNRRISLESRINRSPKKEKRSPAYCIKDMTAMFESKYNQSS